MSDYISSLLAQGAGLHYSDPQFQANVTEYRQRLKTCRIMKDDMLAWSEAISAVPESHIALQKPGQRVTGGAFKIAAVERRAAAKAGNEQVQRWLYAHLLLKLLKFGIAAGLRRTTQVVLQLLQVQDKNVLKYYAVKKFDIMEACLRPLDPQALRSPQLDELLVDTLVKWSKRITDAMNPHSPNGKLTLFIDSLRVALHSFLKGTKEYRDLDKLMFYAWKRTPIVVAVNDMVRSAPSSVRTIAAEKFPDAMRYFNMLTVYNKYKLHRVMWYNTDTTVRESGERYTQSKKLADTWGGVLYPGKHPRIAERLIKLEALKTLRSNPMMARTDVARLVTSLWMR